MSIVEAVLLASVAVLAAWSGYSSAKWSNESRLDLAKASAARSEANRANLDAIATRDLDSTTFNAWFTAYLDGNQEGMAIAEKRFRPEFKVAFDAWIATDPANNPQAAPGPTYMADYQQPDVERSTDLDAQADALWSPTAPRPAATPTTTSASRSTSPPSSSSSGSAETSGSGAPRIGLIVAGSGILIYGALLLIVAPKPPS